MCIQYIVYQYVYLCHRFSNVHVYIHVYTVYSIPIYVYFVTGSQYGIISDGFFELENLPKYNHRVNCGLYI